MLYITCYACNLYTFILLNIYIVNIGNPTLSGISRSFTFSEISKYFGTLDHLNRNFREPDTARKFRHSRVPSPRFTEETDDVNLNYLQRTRAVGAAWTVIGAATAITASVETFASQRSTEVPKWSRIRSTLLGTASRCSRWSSLSLFFSTASKRASFWHYYYFKKTKSTEKKQLQTKWNSSLLRYYENFYFFKFHTVASYLESRWKKCQLKKKKKSTKLGDDGNRLWGELWAKRLQRCDADR